MSATPAVHSALVVDDDASARRVFTLMLRSLGVSRIAEAADGAEAMRTLQGQEFDLVLCDLTMPREDGLVFLRRLATLSRKPAVIIISGRDTPVLDAAVRLAAAHELRVLGAAAKPFTSDTLGALIDTMGDRGGMETVAAAASTPSATLGAEDVKRLMAAGALEVWFQPQVHIASGRVRGAEALLRVRPEASPACTTAMVVAAAERTGAIRALTEFVLAQAVACCAHVRATTGQAFGVSVNLSNATLSDPGYADVLMNQVTGRGLPAGSVTFEVTESMLAESPVAMLELTSRLRMNGFGLAIDDFGTGYASLSQVRELPFNELKLDRTFVQSALDDRRSALILENSLALAVALALETVGEGVETPEHLALLASTGCEYAQGYLISPPLGRDDLVEWVSSRPAPVPPSGDSSAAKGPAGQSSVEKRG